jgi:hypothetical protein
MKLHFGVFDVPYRLAPSRRQRKARAGTVTTSDVAGFLENKYGLMEAFFESQKDGIVGDLEEGLQGVLESFLMGAPPQLDAFGSGVAKIEDRFKQFLSTQKAEQVGIPGVPTEAALAGVNPRLKRPHAKGNPRRPSFIATGLFQSSFKAWVTR